MPNDVTRPITAFASCFILLATVVAPSAAGQGQPPGAAAPASAQAVVQFRVVDAAGVPVVDLKQADVGLKVDGRDRPLRSFEFVRLASGRGVGRAVLDPPFATNESAGRLVFIVLDDESFATGVEQPLRQAVRQLLLGLSPADRVALVTVRGTVNLGPTARHGAITAALAATLGGGADANTANAAACRAKVVLGALTDLFGRLTGAASSTVFFVAGGLAPLTKSAGVARGSGPETTCEVTTDELNRVRAAAAFSGADFYAVQVMGMTAGAAGSVGRGGADTSATLTGEELSAGLENLSATGGHALIRLTGNNADVMARAAAAASAYYRATFDPAASDRPGSSQLVGVAVARSGVKVAAPSHVIIPRPDSSVPVADPKGISVRDMMARTQAYREVQLRASTFTARGRSDREMKVVTLFQPLDLAVRLKAASVGAFDRDGKLKGQWTARPGDLAGAMTVAAFTVPPGSYRLRLAVTDGSGRGGTVDDDLQANLVRADPFKLSDLVLGTTENGRFEPSMVIGNQSVLTGYFEIYGAATKAAVSATIELASSDDGPTIVEGSVAINTTEDKDTQVARGLLPVGSLPPGDYAVRVIVTVGDRTTARLVRTLRKAAR